MNPETTYLVAGTKPWNHQVFEDVISTYPGTWNYISHSAELTTDRVAALSPRYIFFLHWSWKVPLDVVNNYHCVCFHMTDVPFGRGGSPLQNLISRGHRSTKLSALRMVEDYDAGPVYLKEDLSLEGNAEEIYIRASYLSARMIHRILEEEPEPQPQVGPVTAFSRRKTHESRIPALPSLQAMHDFIRMLDAEGYPPAFIDYNGFRIQFSRAQLYNGRIIADVRITRERGEA